MASSCARRTLLSSSASAATILNGCRSSSSSHIASGATKLGGFASTRPTSARLSRHKLPLFSRLPVELGCAQSLMPLHSVTASALLKSMLSLNAGNWGWLSEGFATPL
ncbi:PREDICTED: protein NUCLEAR FUSION DEFECTIVE 6, chloroplastic/mitochondrial [Nelumbo nucifera]|uniref:Protein NUCLEAR FUSION DEFECTIVE 6, chloroplastic/mitochondrial n=1 Tax=Nelumbo nucifera TaxID=4432 RepID=A0A1U7ZEN9_NELNU|nr:PREDICTED: protein NUCLEAR FUSION DEFECTIVE 6, chloroplastic/mitochondrial [Nelumbo nucifera]